MASLCLCGLPRAFGEEADVRFSRVGVEQGLSSSWVLAVQRDSRGFLWVGTQDGLNRYDGRTVVTYRHVPGDPGSLPSSVAGVLFEDSQRRLWVGSRWSAEGLALYDRERDRFVRVPYGERSEGLSDGRVNALAEAPRGRLWVGTRHGLELLDPAGGASQVFGFGRLAAGRPAPRQVVSLLAARGGRVWVGTTEGLFVFDRQAGLCVPWRQPGAGEEPHRNPLEGARVEALLEDGDSVWVATLGRGLFEIDASQNRVVQHYLPRSADPASLSRADVRCLARDGQGRLWIGTENGGLDRFDRRSGRFQHFVPRPDDPRALGSASIYALHVDGQGLVWIGTYNDGVNLVSPAEQRFLLVTARPGGLRDSHVTSFLEDRAGQLWVGSDGGGLQRFADVQGGATASFVQHPGAADSLGSDSVLSLLEDERGLLWIGSWHGGLTRLDPATRQTRCYRHREGDPTSIVSDDVWKLRLLRTGELLVATQRGVDLFDRRTGAFSRLSARYPGFDETMTLTALEDSRGNLWLGHSGRVQHIDRVSGQVFTYRSTSERPTEMGAGMVFALSEDQSGNLWIGGEGGLRLLPASATVGDELVQLPAVPSGVTNVLDDGAGNIWVTTTQGLTRLGGAVLNPRQAERLDFDVRDGLQSNEFTRGAGLRVRSGRIYLGGRRGFNVFEPGAIHRDEAPPTVVMSGLRIFNRPAQPGHADSPLQRSMSETRELVLSQDFAVVTFEFAALDLALPSKVRYAYRLEGLERDWNDAGERREATYTQLRHGDYVLHVRASNHDGVWGEGLSLPVHVSPRWHERRLVRLLLALLVVGVAVGSWRWRVRQWRLREAELSRRVEERTHALNQLNEQLEQRVRARTAELQSEKERLAVTLRSIGDAVVATDVDGRLVLMNRIAEQLTGWTGDDARGRRLDEVVRLLDPASRQPRVELVPSVLAGRAAWSLPSQSLLVHREGREMVVAESLAPIRDQASQTVGVVLVFRDISEQRRVEERLQESQRLEALGILAGGIAHDFNNLLTGIFGYVDLSRRRLAGRPEEAESLARAMTVIERARGLTGQLLTFSRGGEPVTEPLPLGDLLRRSVEFALSGSNVACELTIPSDLWPCEGDRRQIDQVIDNLLINARQAMSGGGTVEIAADNVELDGSTLPLERGRYLRIRVRDQGAGIPPEIASRIFEPFFTTKAQGTGLGLATSYSIVRKHHGCIEVDSQPGRGSTFSVYLPAATAVEKRAHEAAAPPSQRQGRILLMEDQDYVREVVEGMLRELGHEVVSAADGDGILLAAGQARTRGERFDAVMLDLTIPRGDSGQVVLSRLREIDPEVPAIATSGYSGDPVMSDPQAHGFVARLAKPFTIDDLEATIAKALAR